MITRRDLLVSATGLTLVSTAGLTLAAALPAWAAGSPGELRIGLQKSGAILVAKQQGLIERRLTGLGVGPVKWIEFPAGPPLLEALSVGSIDVGTTGDTPPIFAQAAGADLLYVARIPAASSAILVPESSPLRSLADLQGKRVAFTKGSSAHNITVEALRKAGLSYTDITPIYLSPADAAAAFARGSVDAWTIWDPFFALAEKNQRARALARVEDIVASSSFYLANARFAKARPDVLKAVIEELAQAGAWAEANRDALAQVLSEATSVDLEAQRGAVRRARYSVEPITPEIAAQQQAIADQFHALGLIPKPIIVRDAVWTPPAS
jgi:sulfonate transport system substrate-binding protein